LTDLGLKTSRRAFISDGYAEIEQGRSSAPARPPSRRSHLLFPASCRRLHLPLFQDTEYSLRSIARRSSIVKHDVHRPGSLTPVVAEPSIGSVIKRLRREKGMSLQELAKASGVSVGMISQVERDISNPSVRVLTALRRALDAPLSAMFGDSPGQANDPDFVRRADRRPRLHLGEVSKELLTAGGQHNLQIMILHIEPHGSSGDTPLRYPAEKGGMVLAGEILLKVGDDEALLREGDSFVFDSSIPHGFRNPQSAPAKVLWIIGAVSLDRHL
jgi:transcriptional regulator with XRE-family HTH domain